MLRTLSACLLCTLWLAVPAAAQRPKSAAEALQRLEQARDRSEADRKRPVGDLADFEGAEVTAALLAELARAEDLGYLQTVVRALGAKPRDGAAPALQKVLREASNNRLMDSAAEGLSRQGEAGVQALAAVLAEESKGGARRTAACDGLGRADSDAARDVLLKELKAIGGRDRLPILRALAHRKDDGLVDAQRLALVGDRDALVAATALRQLADHKHDKAQELGRQLLRRLAADASSEHYTAVLHALLTAPATADAESVLLATARAEDPFGTALLPSWQTAVANPTFLRWLLEQAPSRKQPNERAFAAQALALCQPADRAAVAPVLQRLLNQKEPEVVKKAADALAACGAELALPALQKLLTSGAEAFQPFALHAVHSLRHAEPAWAEELLRYAVGKPILLRTAALQLLAKLPRLDPNQAVQVAADSLNHPAWQVRGAAIDLLVAVRQPAGIPLLIERLEVERNRLQLDVGEALHALTGMRLADVATWRQFWQKEGEHFQVPAPKAKDKAPGRNDPPATVASYWNIPVRSDRVAFVVDVSGSMNQPFGTGSGTRLDEAKRQLVRVVGMLPAKAKANVIAFAGGTELLATTLQPLDDKRKKLVEVFAQKLTSRGPTNVHGAIQAAFADPEVDTIFLLTDGAPSSGEIVAPDALAKAVAAWNLGRHIRIHTIAIGGKSDFLERLARESGGEHSVAR